MKKNKKIFHFIIIITLIIYISSYYISNSGYYEYHLQKKTILTNEKIKEFETDIKNNQNIDVKDYLGSEEIDYSNKISDLVYNFSTGANKVAKDIIKTIFNKLSYLVED